MEIQLTSFGKRLLSKGMLNPCYYSFHDDDIIYDMRYAGGPPDERNYAQDRVLEETPRMRNQVYNFCIEEQVTREIEKARSGIDTIDPSSLLETNSDNLSNYLARSSLTSDYAPAWDLTIYGERFNSYKSVQKLPSGQIINIPQANIEDCDFKTYVSSDDSLLRDYSDIDVAFTTYNNGNTIGFDAAEFIIEVDEENTIPLTKNYEIEVYVTEEEFDQNKNLINREVRKLNFIKDQQSSHKIVDDVLVEIEPREIERGSIDDSYVEYYLNIQFDNQISKDLLCELGYRTDYSKRGHIPVDCSELDTPQGDSVYDSEPPVSPFGDDC